MNPFQAIMGTVGCQTPQNMPPAKQMGNGQSMDWNALMGQLQANPGAALKNAGYNVPEELTGNPQAAVMHLIQSGQVGGHMMQRIQPLLQRMGFR